MTEYMRGVFALSCVISVCSLLVYKEKKDFSVRFAFATVIVYAALMPVISFFTSSHGAPSFDYEFDLDGYSEDYIEVAEDAFCEGIKRFVSDEYGLESDEVFVFVEGFDFSSMRAEKIRIILSGASVFSDLKAIEKDINELDVGRCSVEIEIG